LSKEGHEKVQLDLAFRACAMNSTVLRRASTPGEEAGVGTTGMATADVMRIGDRRPCF
jgi:hypothetical protein